MTGSVTAARSATTSGRKELPCKKRLYRSTRIALGGSDDPNTACGHSLHKSCPRSRGNEHIGLIERMRHRGVEPVNDHPLIEIKTSHFDRCALVCNVKDDEATGMPRVARDRTKVLTRDCDLHGADQISRFGALLTTRVNTLEMGGSMSVIIPLPV